MFIDILVVLLFNHPQGGVVYNFGRVCLSVCLFICQTITFEGFDILSSYWHITHPVYLLEIRVKFVYEGYWVKVSWKYGSSSYMKVIGSRSRSQEPKNVENLYSRNVKLLTAITPIL